MMKKNQIQTRKKWSHYRRRKERIVAMESDEKNEKEKKGNPAKGVLFVPNTENSVLAIDIRETIQSLRPWTLMNIKVVERSGDKLQDLLCKSNPWDNQDCKRENCFSCKTAVKDEKVEFRNGRQRSVLYET